MVVKLYISLTLPQPSCALIKDLSIKEFSMQSRFSNSMMDASLWTQRAIRRLTLPIATFLFSVSFSALAQPYVNVTISGAIAPGVYGQVVVGNNPPPPVLNPQPVIVGQPIYGAAPMYLYVPPEHQRDWARYCERYRACGRPVHFVHMEEHNRRWAQRNEHSREPEHDRRSESRREEREHDEGRERR
jgi:hypothetical protein